MQLSVDKSRHNGFTIVELLISSAVGLMVLAGAMAAFVYGLRTWRSESIVSELHQNLESAMENIRHDLRLSSVGVGLMAFHPTNAAQYTAISMPHATPGPDGLLVRDLNTNSLRYGQIVWDRTVIYHVRHGTPDELLRTVFTPRNTNATAADFQAQLELVVASQDDIDLQDAAMAGEAVESRVVFRNLVAMRIRPPEMRFDGYAPTYQRARNLNWGSIVLGDGLHDLTFRVVGKNDASAGYKVGIDGFSLSTSASWREGEMFVVNNAHPTAPFYQSEHSGGTVTADDMSVHGAGWSGRSQLTFTPAAVGDELTLKVHNDLWCDAQFANPRGLLYSNVSTKLDTTFSTQPPYIPEFAVSMDQGVTWTAESLSDAAAGSLVLTNTTPVFNVIYGDGSEASVMRYNGARARGCFSRLPPPTSS